MAKYELYGKLSQVTDAQKLLLLMTSESERKKIRDLLQEFEDERGRINAAIQVYGKTKEIENYRTEAKHAAELANVTRQDAERDRAAFESEMTKERVTLDEQKEELALETEELRETRQELKVQREAEQKVLTAERVEMEARIKRADREQAKAETSCRLAEAKLAELQEWSNRMTEAAERRA